ncbi:Paired amphipathic helix protein Sin3-like 1 [Glycine max]|nr:Paired amphipathic helix protein Sin3-like 1 [Glycine max]
MEEILKDHGDLILGFNKFLPKGYEILLLDEGEDGFGNASKYLKKIQDRFENKDHVYKSFLNILLKYKNNGVTLYDTYHESIQRSGQSQFESESYIKTWMQSSKRDVYLGAYLNGGHWQMVVILPKEHLVFWFCSLYKRPGNYLKEIINSALKCLDDAPQPKSKAPARWIVVKCNRQKGSTECGCYVMHWMSTIILGTFRNNWETFIGAREIKGIADPVGTLLSPTCLKLGHLTLFHEQVAVSSAKPPPKPDPEVDDPLYLMTLTIPELFLRPYQVTWDATVFGVFNPNFPLYIKTKTSPKSYTVVNVSAYQHFTETSMREGNSDIYGFLEPQSIQRSGQSQLESESYIKIWMQSSKRDVYLGVYLNGGHWQMVVILPKEHLVVWFCSLYNRPDNYLKGIINIALKGLDDAPQPKSKAPARWIIVKCNRQKGSTECGYYVMHWMSTIILGTFRNNWEAYFNDPRPLEPERLKALQIQWAHYYLLAATLFEGHRDLVRDFTKHFFQYQIMSVSGQKITIMDALQYIKEVQCAFHDSREKFDKFMDVMKDYKFHRIDVGIVVEKMEEILKDHGDLILGFNKFLPKGYEILLLDEGEDGFGNASKYLKKIQDRFENKDHVYKSFLNILLKYKNNGVTLYDTYHEVATLFEGHRDLVRDFTKFLPSVHLRGKST